jgi:hypothetical protein
VLRSPDSSKQRLWVTPGTALAFSVLMAFLAPRYPEWFGGSLPPFTQQFLAIYPLWIAISAAALAAAAIGAQIPPLARRHSVWHVLDIVLSVASILIIAAGVIALFLPIFTRAGPT